MNKHSDNKNAHDAETFRKQLTQIKNIITIRNRIVDNFAALT